VNLGTRDEGQWSDSKVEPLWITATKQVFIQIWLNQENHLFFKIRRVKKQLFSFGRHVTMNFTAFDRWSTVGYIVMIFLFERRWIMLFDTFVNCQSI